MCLRGARHWLSAEWNRAAQAALRSVFYEGNGVSKGSFLRWILIFLLLAKKVFTSLEMRRMPKTKLFERC